MVGGGGDGRCCKFVCLLKDVRVLCLNGLTCKRYESLGRCSCFLDLPRIAREGLCQRYICEK